MAARGKVRARDTELVVRAGCSAGGALALARGECEHEQLIRAEQKSPACQQPE
jgi:hypothetical protein